MNILAVSSWYGANAPRFLVDALERVGFNIFRIGPRYDFHLDMQWTDSEMPKIDLELPKNTNWYIDDYVDMATRVGCTPDLVFISEESYNNLIVNTDKIPSALWSLDGWQNQLDRIDMIKPTIGYQAQPRGNQFEPREEDDPRWKFLPSAAAPWIHQCLGLERTIDFTLLATMYTKRPAIVEGLKSQGFSVIAGQKKTPEYVRGYNKSLATYHNPGWHEAKYRFFESAMIGCLNISATNHIFDRLGYQTWRTYVPVITEMTDDGPWATPEAIGKVLTDIKNNPVFFKGIATAARQLTCERNSYYNRCQTILADLDMEKEAEQCQPFIDGAWKEHLGEL